MELAIEQIRSGKIQAAHDLVRKYGARDGFEAAWTAWMSTQFGWRQEVTDGGNEDVLRLPYYRPIGALDPLNSRLRTDAHWVKQVFDTLVEWDAERHQPVPHLALEWDCDESGRQWIFYLRKGVRFHHGAELTSEDVVYSLNRLRTSGDRSDYWALLIRKIAPLGPLAVSITLKEPNSLFLHVLASPRFTIAAKDHKPLIGSGPFTIEEQTKERFVLKAFAGGLFLHQMIRSDIGLWKSYLPAPTKEELEKLLEQALMNLDGFMSVEAIRQMDVILQEEHAVLCLFHNIVSTVIHRRLRGVKLSSSGWLRFKDVWFSPRETQ
ncbi:ABC transporter substrate-binding protein [Paenibacillus silviterrae]|uniref:ABC transporter substrate-binding protein n=1 Tax=Paenibacillus silviterrae TaxID=3242194 RepID=UPI002543F6CA|nr:ABC transporter substrate-binding protein [Paenibacillus chinjuensis]